MQIAKIHKVPLREIWKREDKDFSAWLEENIDYLNDIFEFDISVESREEAVGPFRVDLWGEDNFGQRVIIENQLERTDHDHLGKVITYLTNLSANRAVWITKEPREEHMRAIEWLNEITPDDITFYLVKVEAIRIGDHPVAAPQFTIVQGPSVESKQIGAEKKAFAKRHHVRLEFWKEFIDEMNTSNNLCSNLNPGKDNWLGIALGWSGVSVNCVVSKNYARTEVYINRGDIDENKRVFDYFADRREVIENDFGAPLEWERMDDKITSRIKFEKREVDLNNREDWPAMIEHMKHGAVKMESAIRKHVRALKSKGLTDDSEKGTQMMEQGKTTYSPNGPTVCEGGLNTFDNSPQGIRGAFLQWSEQCSKAFNIELHGPYTNIQGDNEGVRLCQLLQWYLFESPSAYRFQGMAIPALPDPTAPIPAISDWQGLDKTLLQVVSLMVTMGEITEH